jgi:hypothetical protein
MSPKRAIATAILCVGGTIFAGTAASANVILDYTGKNFTSVSGPYTTSERVTGTITLSGPLAANLNFFDATPVSFSFNDGVQTISNLNALAATFSFWTDASGNITEYAFEIANGANFWDQINVNNLPCCATEQGIQRQSPESYWQGLNSTSVGNLSIVSAPEPMTVSLFGAGLVGAVTMRRRKKQAA